MITQLTPEQEAAMPKYVEMGIKIGLATCSDMDEELVRDLTDKHRAVCGLPKASEFIVVDSPIAAYKYGATPADALYGQHDVHWLMHFLFFRIECGLIKETQPIVHLVELAKHIGWWWTNETVTIVSRRPEEIHLITQKKNNDSDERIQCMHNPKGPAIRYRDGFAVYILYGTRLPTEYEWIVKDNINGTLTLKKVLACKNSEMVTLGLRVLGPEALVTQGKPIDKWTSKIGGKYVLYEVEVSGNKRMYLSGNCPSKGAPFCEPVPPDMKSCQEALHWREEPSGILFSGTYQEPVIRT
jgi:hypothetical protein